MTSPSPIRRSPRLQQHAQSLTTSNVSTERRSLQFCDSEEPATLNSSVDIRLDFPSSSPESCSWTVPPNSKADLFSNLSTQPQDSQARRISEVDTVQRVQTPQIARKNVGEGEHEKAQPETESELVRISQASDYSRNYNFLLKKVVAQNLRSLLKVWDWRQRGKKDNYIANCMLQIKLFSLSGMDIVEVLSKQRETSGHGSWLKEKLRTDELHPVQIKKARSEDHFISYLKDSEAEEFSKKRAAAEEQGNTARECGNPNRTGLSEQSEDPAEIPANQAMATSNALTTLVTGSAVQLERPAETPQNPWTTHNFRTTPQGSTESQPQDAIARGEGINFGINDFARLLVTMRDDEDARAATVAMGQELTRAQMDMGVTRGDFWTIIEDCFNDPSNRRFLNLAGAVDGIDSNLSPLAYRTGTFLKDKFNDAKADFTQYRERWAASGQNDPDRFKHFLPVLSNSRLTVV